LATAGGPGGFLAQMPIWVRPDGDLSAARGRVTPRPPKPLPRWLAWWIAGSESRRSSRAAPQPG